MFHSSNIKDIQQQCALHLDERSSYYVLTVAPMVVWLWCTYRGAPWWCFVQVTQVLQSPDVVREQCGVNTELMR